MDVGLLTFYHIHHYGAPLQAAALGRAVERLGGSCEIIDYYVNQDNSLFRPPVGIRAAASDLHTALRYPALRRRYERFEAFSRAHLRIGPRRYESFEELRQADLPYEVLLCGSDQIWNPTIFPDRRFDPVFFGAVSDARKIAYAPSFGVPRIPEGMEERARELLSPFSHLSAREPSGREILREIAGRDAPVVLDPTLLLTAEDWSSMAARPDGLPESYLLVYCISDPAVLGPYVRALSERTGLPVVQLCGIRRKVHPSARGVLDAGPAEFLGLLSGASMVVTNSFHGTAFAVQYHRPFFTAVSPAERADPERSRTFALLDRLGIADRIAGTGVTADLDAPIDWEAVSASLSEAREASLSYLRAALHGDPYRIPEEAPRRDLPRLASHEQCTGCTACQSVCPKDAVSMVRDREGFAFPAVDPARCVRCGRCTAVCPPLHPRVPSPDPPAAYAAWTADRTVRARSSSGGVFSALAGTVLDRGGVVYGAALDPDQHLRHAACTSREDLDRLRGAKYVQSDLGDTFREIRRTLDQGREVLFTGTPCQTDGLRRYLGGRSGGLTVCDLVCHGVPSPGVWEDVVRSWEEDAGQEVREVRFRDKSDGWARPRLTVTYADGHTVSRPLYESGYGRAFGRALLLRRCCYRCPYAGLDRPGDLGLGDCWGLGPEDLPEEQRDGISLLLVESPHGERVLDQIPVIRRPWPLDRAVSGNPNLSAPTARPADRDAFFSAYALDPFGQVRRRWISPPSLPVRIAKKILSPKIRELLRGKR